MVSTTKKEAVARPTLKFLRDKEKEMVRGKFIYHECPGGFVEFPFKKYKEDEVQVYKLYDGEAYTIPLAVAKHLNKNCWYPIHSYALDDNGKPLMKIGQKVRRMSFQSLEFIDDEDMTPAGSSIMTAEMIG